MGERLAVIAVLDKKINQQINKGRPYQTDKGAPCLVVALSLFRALREFLLWINTEKAEFITLDT